VEQGKYVKNKKSGEWTFYNERGVMIRKQSFLNDVPDGQWVEFYPNGNKHSEGCYKQLVKTGAWVYYTEKGAVIRKMTYKNGKVSKVSN
jgi:antitoxin component YwqK of YwqJK toxin-antitoxin module